METIKTKHSALPVFRSLRMIHIFPILVIALIIFGTDTHSQTSNDYVGAFRETPLHEQSDSVPVRAKSLSPLRQQTGFEPGVIPGSDPEFTVRGVGSPHPTPISVIPAPYAVIPAIRCTAERPESVSVRANGRSPLQTPYTFANSYYPWLERPSPRIDMPPDSLPPNQVTDEYVILFNAVGPNPGSMLGRYLVSAGDQNGDGFDDILATCIDPQEVRLYFGGNPMDTIPDMVFPSPVGSTWLTLPTELADLNSDYDTDIVIASAFGMNHDTVYVYYGGVLLNNTIDLRLLDNGSIEPGGYFGGYMSCGDLNRDNCYDLAIDAPNYYVDSYGKINIYFGGFEFDSIPDFTIASGYNNFGGLFGANVSIAGDVNNDGFDDLLCRLDTETTEVGLFFGNDILDSIPDWMYGSSNHHICSGIIQDLNDDDYDEIAEIIQYSMYGHQTNIFFGGETLSDEPDLIIQGSSNGPRIVKSAGNINADEFNDLIIGNEADNWVKIYFGGDPMDNQPDITFNLPDAGYDVGFAGDVNGDGIHDFMFYANDDALTSAGQIFIYSDPGLTPHVEPWYGGDLPSSFTLYQNFPNPFNGATVIPFQCQKAGWVDLNIYNILGQKVYSLSHNASAGEQVRILWDGTDMNGNVLPSGVYLVELSDGWERETMKVQIVR